MKQFAVVGDPIEHSLSPMLHKEIYRQLGIKASFEIAHIEKEYLQIFINENKLDGFNVTIPHKESIIPYLDKLPSIVVVIDELADMMMTTGKKAEELIARLAQ